MSGELNTKNVGMEVMSLIGDFLKNHVATATVGKVDIVNSDGTVNVQPLLNLPAIDGTQTVHAVIPNVRILFNANCQLSITVTAGDIVLVVFCKESLGGLSMSGSPANSLLNQMFSEGNAVAIPLIYSAAASGQLALMTANYKSNLETFLTYIKTALNSLGTATNLTQVIAAGSAFTAAFTVAFPTGFYPAIDTTGGLTQKVKAL